MNTWAEAMKAIGALEDRVKKLEGYCFGTQVSVESLIRVGEVTSIPGNFKFIDTKPQPSITETGRIVVDANEYDRLRKIDHAARELFLWLRPGETTWLDRESSILKPLRDALYR